jgi:hypothetical protein
MQGFFLYAVGTPELDEPVPLYPSSPGNKLVFVIVAPEEELPYIRGWLLSKEFFELIKRKKLPTIKARIISPIII